MKFTITREQLQAGLAAVQGAVPSKTTLPVLANVLVEATKDGLRLSGTDLDLWIRTTISASVDQEGAITLPAKKLAEIVRTAKHESSVWVFTNVDMFADAKRLKKLLKL